jgi:hypothetical protein
MLYAFKTKSFINIKSLYLIKEQAGTLEGVRMLEQAREQAGIIEHKWKMLRKQVYCYNCRAVL